MTRAEEVALKLARLREMMDREELQAVALSAQTSFAWLTGGGDSHVALASAGGVATLLVTADQAFAVTDNIEAGRLAEEELVGLDFEIVADDWFKDNARELIARRVTGQVAADGNWLAGAIDASEELAALRRQLLPPEVDRYRGLGLDVSRCLEETAREIEPGQSEHQIAGVLAGKVEALGIAPNVILIAADERVRKFRHPIPTANRLHHYAMLVACVRRHGLSLSATRLVHFGPLPDDLRQRHDACVKVDACFNLESRPGAKVKDIFAKAVAMYSETGYAGEWRLHHQGGATGYAPREYKATPSSEETVYDRQAFAWNPSIAGAKSEDTILVTTEGPEVLSPPQAWPMIEVEYEGVMLPRPDILVR